MARNTVMIKPCPFCGGQVHLEKAHRAYIEGKSTKVCFVRCLDCNARSGRVDIADYGYSSHSIEAENKAIEMWNRRM